MSHHLQNSCHSWRHSWPLPSDSTANHYYSNSWLFANIVLIKQTLKLQGLTITLNMKFPWGQSGYKYSLFRFESVFYACHLFLIACLATCVLPLSHFFLFLSFCIYLCWMSGQFYKTRLSQKFCHILVMWGTALDAFYKNCEGDEPNLTLRYWVYLIISECYSLVAHLWLKAQLWNPLF